MSSFTLTNLNVDKEHLDIFSAIYSSGAIYAKQLVSHHWKTVVGVLAAVFIAVFFVHTVYHLQKLESELTEHKENSKERDAKATLKLLELKSELTEHKGNLEDRGELRRKLVFTFNTIPLFHEPNNELKSEQKEIGGNL
uniref:Uncharacterized protein n=1 Tax=Ditylenchus dipsaci TaxID=166011 RepID=A0A915CPG7_9BILA